MTLAHWIVGPQIVGLIMLVVGYIQKRFPPKHINNWYGYRTATSQKSQQVWDYAQIYSANLLMKYGAIAIIIGLLLTAITPLKYEILMVVTTIFAGMGIAVTVMVKTENHLEKKFNDKTE
jgi:uncharacterized membrane protein